MIYTSYYGNVKNLPKDSILMGISRTTPKDFRGYSMKILAPNSGIFSNWLNNRNENIYIEDFGEQLSKTDVKYIIESLNKLIEDNNNVDLFLLCYEKPNDFCHRHIVAEWLCENKCECKEWTNGRKR